MEGKSRMGFKIWKKKGEWWLELGQHILATNSEPGEALVNMVSAFFYFFVCMYLDDTAARHCWTCGSRKGQS